MGGTVVQTSNRICSLVLVSSDFTTKVTAQAIVLPQLTKILPRFQPTREQRGEWSPIQLADPICHSPSQIDLVIGSDLTPQIMLEGIEHISKNLLAQKTIFGWILSGQMPNKVVSFSTQVEQNSNQLLESQLRKFWEVEEVPTPNLTNPEDKLCEELYLSTTSRTPEGPYIVRLPFKQSFPNEITLGQSRTTALQQFFGMGRSLQKKGDLKPLYDNVLGEYRTLNHMEETTSYEKSSEGKYYSFYLPTTRLSNPRKEPPRYVSYLMHHGDQVPDSLLMMFSPTGPTLQPDLMLLILKGHTYQFVFNGDVEKMYRQILLHKDHQNYQRIVFRSSPSSPIRDYRLRTVKFGVNCAPFLAIRTLHQLSDDVKITYPLAVPILKTETTYFQEVMTSSQQLNLSPKSFKL
ncbi:PREDICTED: uncharacterized protein LOC108354690 [Rhagoletis zephyria]|uniref:uncharacterized protein LOC108354690 n=1 Tax=Rhagoletis zephyria TaxID=28612 RepID=UPI0008118856|nr:PREDICTED: uncharacterized protein LOC108354690 [Rhagoletis zephyria]